MATATALSRWQRSTLAAVGLALAVATAIRPAAARPVNVEFRFTPYRPGAPGAEEVSTPAGDVELELNGVPMLRAPLEPKTALLMGRDAIGPELAPSLWISALELQPILRRGDNRLRLRFTPREPGLRYRSGFRWLVVEDAVTTETPAEGRLRVSNHGASGGEDRDSQGTVTLEHAFQAPFAPVEPWHGAPPVTSLQPADRTAILALLAERAALFRPDFDAAYRLLAGLPDRGVRLDGPEARRLGCLEAGYATGIRVAAPLPGDLQLITTGSPVVVARGAGDYLFRFPDLEGVARRFEALPNDTGFCFVIGFNLLFPKQMLLVRDASGAWRILP